VVKVCGTAQKLLDSNHMIPFIKISLGMLIEVIHPMEEEETV